MDQPEPKRSRLLGWLVIGANVFSAVAIALLHWLQSDLDPLNRAISEYVHGSYGFLMTTTFFSQSLGSLALAACFVTEGLKERRTLVSGILFIVSAVGAAVAGIFPADVASPFPQTSTGAVHAAAGLIRFLSLALALPLLSSLLGTHPQFRKAVKALTPLAILFVIIFLVSIFVLANIGLFGLGQRIFIGILLVWMSLAVYPVIQREDIIEHQEIEK